MHIYIYIDIHIYIYIYIYIYIHMYMCGHERIFLSRFPPVGKVAEVLRNAKVPTDFVPRRHRANAATTTL